MTTSALPATIAVGDLPDVPLRQPRWRTAIVALLYRGFFAAAGLGATAYSYMGIVSLLLELDAPPWVAWGLGGFIEAGLIGSALGALHAVMTGRDPALFMTLTWTLSLTTGGLAAWHESMVRADPAIWVALRLVVPFCAAVFWHVLLAGASHLNAGVNPTATVISGLSRLRASRRAWAKERDAETLMHAVIRAGEDVRAAESGDAGRTSVPRRGRRTLTLRELHDREREARDAALRVLGIEEYRARYSAWVRDLRAADIERAGTAQFGGPSPTVMNAGGGADKDALGTAGILQATKFVTDAAGRVESGGVSPRVYERGGVAPVSPSRSSASGGGVDLTPLLDGATASQRAARSRALQAAGVDFEIICSVVGRSRRTVFRYLEGEDTDTPAHGLAVLAASER